jgi:hypothetical protein
MIRRVLTLAVMALAVSAVPALADAPDPIPSQTQLAGPIVHNPDGSFTVTVQGAWQWTTHHSNCNLDRSGVGVAIAWNDPSDPGNFVGKNGLSALVGTSDTSTPPNAQWFGVNQHDGNLVHPTPAATPNGPFNDPGLGNPFDPAQSKVTYFGGTPSQTDANNWISGCGTFNGTYNTGVWGPISHTYPAGFTGPISVCPIMYDPHQGPAGTANGNVGQIIAGGAGHNGDNSIETNGTTPLGNGCFSSTIPTLTTTAQTPVALGSPITDTAHLSGGSAPTGTITFTLFGPNNTTCSGAPIYTSDAVPVNGNADYPSNPPGAKAAFVPTALGTYRWKATYSGDTHNVSVPTSCNDANEQSVVGPAAPVLTTQASASAPVGSSISDVATLTGGSSPTGTVSWNVYGPGDTSCLTPLNGAPLTATVSGGKATSPGFIANQAGTYRFIATYSGDANNAGSTSSCNDAAEAVVVTPLSPQLTTNADSGGPVGTSVHDVAHLSGATSAAGGSITFRLYGPNDASCATAIYTNTVAVNGNNDYLSGSVAPTAAGTYRWVASYSGDANNNPAATSCIDPAEASVITSPPPLTPGIAVIKYQRIDGTTGAYTHDTLTVTAGQKVDYEMVVSNTGDVPLALAFSDPHCDAGSLTGPTGDLNPDGTLKPHGQATYFCFHIAVAGDAPAYTNIVTVSGTPPSGPPVGPVSSTVVANVPQQAVQASCVTGSVGLNGAVGCTRRAFQAVVQAAPSSVKSVSFKLDGKTIRVMTHVGAGNKWAITISPGKLRFGAHTLVAQVTLICNGAKRTVTLHFRRCRPPRPRFTG